MNADTGFKNGKELDAACKWPWTAFGVERPMAAEVLCWEKCFSRTPYYAGKKYPTLSSLKSYILQVAKSIVLRQSTFLRDPIWKLVPWEDDPTSKSSIDYLVDIGTDVAECFAQIKTYNSSKSKQEIENSKLRAQAAMSLEELNAWWRQREEEHAQVVTVVASPRATGEPLFPTLLEYDMLWTAFAICTYNAIRILLLQLLTRS